MKKLLVILGLILMIGCSGTLTGEVATSIKLRGSTGIAASTFSVDNSINTIEGASVNEVAYEVINNTGGGGSLAIGITTFGGDCSIVTPALTVPVVAYTNIPITVSSELLTLMQTYYAVSQHRVCLSYTQNVNVPLNLDIRIIVKASKSYSYSTGL